MKIKIVILALIYLIYFKSLAQNEYLNNPEPQKSLGVYLGVGFQNINGKDASGKKLNNSLVPRFNIGINEEIKLAPDFYLNFGLQFINKGTKGTVLYFQDQTSREITREIKMNYLEVPINFVFKPILGKNKIVLGFGPYLGYCLNGKALYSGDSAPSDEKLVISKEVPSNAENNLIYFKRLDIGANFLVGYELRNGFNIVLNSQLGLIKINSKIKNELTNMNTGFGLAFGYRF